MDFSTEKKKFLAHSNLIVNLGANCLMSLPPPTHTHHPILHAAISSFHNKKEKWRLALTPSGICQKRPDFSFFHSSHSFLQKCQQNSKQISTRKTAVKKSPLPFHEDSSLVIFWHMSNCKKTICINASLTKSIIMGITTAMELLKRQKGYEYRYESCISLMNCCKTYGLGDFEKDPGILPFQ